jgi:hypothetical protein
MPEVSEVPETVRALLRDRIENYEQLETLLLLRRGQAIVWSCQAVAQHLNIEPDAARSALNRLCRAGLLRPRENGAEPQFEYGPQLEGDAETVDLLARFYDEARLQIMALMNKFALDRVRSSAARAFADAFVLGKKDG